MLKIEFNPKTKSKTNTSDQRPAFTPIQRRRTPATSLYADSTKVEDENHPLRQFLIDESNEWLLGRMEEDDSGDGIEYVFGDDNLTWEQVAGISGANDPSYMTRASNVIDKGKGIVIESSTAPQSSSRTIVSMDNDDDGEEEEYDVDDENGEDANEDVDSISDLEF